MLSKKYAAVNQSVCVACGACAKECPKSVIKVHKGCYAVVSQDYCIGCGKCARICPAGCIEIKNRGEAI